MGVEPQPARRTIRRDHDHGHLLAAALASKELSAADLALTVACWLLVIAGVALAAWSLTARIRNGLFGKSPDRLAERPPYHRLRRPMTLGVGVVLLGATLLAGTIPAWVCLLAVVLAGPCPAGDRRA